MLDWTDNGFYLLLGLLAFWLPTLGYWFSLHNRTNQLAQEEALLREEAARERQK